MSDLKPKIKLQRLLPWAAMLVLFTMFSITSAKAQCPDDTYGIAPSVTTDPWYGEFCTSQLIPGTSCHIEICYCKRSVGDSMQIWITSIVPDDDGSCDGLSNEYIIHQAQRLVMNDVAGPCLKGVGKVVDVYRAQCWQTRPTITPEGPGPLGLYPCYEGVAYCRKTCYVCADAGGVHISGCTTGPNYVSQLCSTPPPPEPLPWQQDQCYTISCDE